MAANIGKDMFLSYKVGGVAGGGLVAVTHAQDVNPSYTKGEAEIVSRGTGGYAGTKVVLTSLAISWEQLYIDDDSQMIALKAAFFAGTTVGLKVSDVAGKYVQGDYVIVKWDEPEPLLAAATISIEAKLTYPGNVTTG